MRKPIKSGNKAFPVDVKDHHLPYSAAAAAAGIALLVFLPVLRNGFLNWDDNIYVSENLRLAVLDRSFFVWAFTDIATSGFWHPMVWISYALDRALWGLNPLGFHLTNLLLHVLNTFFVVLLAGRLFRPLRAVPPSPRDREGERPLFAASLVAGILFGLHPLHVESVAWISERKDLLYALFYLLSMLSYAAYLASEADGPLAGRPRVPFSNRHYTLSFLFFVLSLSGKSMAITLPFILLLLDWYPYQRLQKPRVLPVLAEKVPFLLGSSVIALISLAGQKARGSMVLLESVGLADRVLVAFKALMLYLRNVVFPVELVPIYPYPSVVSPSSPEYIVPMILTGVVTLACLAFAKRQPIWMFSWLFFVISLLPVSGIIPIGLHFMADRYTYLPILGPALLAGWGADRIWTGIREARGRGTVLRICCLAAVVLLVVLLTAGTLRLMPVWRDSFAFWNYILEKESVNVPIAYVNRGAAYREQGEPERAIADYSTVIAMDTARHMPFSANGATGEGERTGASRSGIGRTSPRLKSALYLAYNNRGELYQEKGWDDRAAEDYAAAIALDPKEPLAYYNRGMLFGKTGQIDRAIDDMTSAVVRDPSFAEAFTNRGWIYKNLGRTDQALADYTAAIEAQPFAATGYFNRALLFGETGRPELAIKDYSRAVELNPAYTAALLNRGLAFEEMHQLDRAMQDFNAAIALDPSRSDAYNNRGVLWEMMGRPELAVEDYGRAIERDARNALAYNNRGTAYGALGQDERALDDQTAAIALDPGFAQAHLDRGKLYEKKGQSAQARRDYQRACAAGIREACDALHARKGMRPPS